MLLENLEEPAILEKPNSERISINVEIDANNFYISDIETPIEVDDIIERRRGSVTDRYVVTEVLPWNKNLQFSLIEPHIQGKLISEKRANRISNAFNVGSITANRVYINATDNSTNILSIEKNNDQKFEELKNIVASLSNNNTVLLSIIEEMRASVGTPTYTSKYKDFMANLANHTTVLQGIAQFTGWLSNLL